jgi:hypothetical protein
MGKLTQANKMPLQQHVSLEPFNKWGMDFVGPIDPLSKQKNYILVCTDYLTKLVEVHVLSNVKEEKVAEILYGDIFNRFNVPHEIVINQGPQLTSKLIKSLANQ